MKRLRGGLKRRAFDVNSFIRISIIVLFIVLLAGCSDKGVNDEAALNDLMNDETHSNNNNASNNTSNASQNNNVENKPSSSNKKDSETRKTFPAGFEFKVVDDSAGYVAGFVSTCVDEGKRCNTEIEDRDNLLKRFVQGDDFQPIPRLKAKAGQYINFVTSSTGSSGAPLPMPDQIELIQLEKEGKDIKTEIEGSQFKVSGEAGRYNYVVKVRWNQEGVFKGEGMYAFSLLVTE
ncbi:hypothetical protein [Lentibacillus saliphilus]|uniref:hypothetical protein n=1 Tax=Lentibacillus saliphilus TaxID=2737028 RepID=UPI001C2FC008|nr:hypothetical protein [Lentibacillus saliphilus]